MIIQKVNVFDTIIANADGYTLQSVIDELTNAGYTLDDFKKVFVEYREYSDWGDPYHRVEISIQREETDEEFEARKEEYLAGLSCAEERERAEYLRLKEKFENE